MKSAVAVITGASRGIGRNVAIHLARQGTSLILMARNEALLSELASDIRSQGGKADFRCLDVTVPSSVNRAFENLEQVFGPVDTLINNAGSFQSINPLWEADSDLWWQDIVVNVRGPMLCSKAIIPSMIEQGHGYIVNVVGGGTKQAMPYGSGYGASKTALARLTETMSAELDGTNVKVFAADPGLNETDMTRYQKESEAGAKFLPQIGDMLRQGLVEPPERAPKLILRVLSGEFDALSGRILSVHENLDEVRENMDAIVTKDLYTLRSNEL